MFIAIGFVIIIACVFGGFVLAGGALGPLLQPLELLIIGGAALGAFIAANSSKSMRATLKVAGKLRASTRYSSATYLALLGLLYQLLTKMRRDGMLAVEQDIENPEESAIFSEFPEIQSDTLLCNFITDYLRLMISGNMNPHELDELMLHEIETFEQEGAIPADALSRVGDAMPAFGIVAAVLGVVRALSSADVAPDVMGTMIAHALVGTFLGILLGYGFVNPVAGRIELQMAEVSKTLQVIRVTLLASAHGYAPQLAVEFGRKGLHVQERPSFTELEQYIRGDATEAA
ncbi:flagellar motor stator protein MotA [Pseudidiomarina insulisalsae]|uniref:Flagellar motor stator protein MotA n=1 Tax=Pseudidiomarina insulisalsae TaxID=575789 RepID=A0A432YDJ7_9GAMM|nr:flagellar motor stator protein MotA [Pseudidiomarina insulisalsae]RUO59068.1 flagellar motor stator protein MotA [Pseudidiomarina insulisalsae]